MTKHSWTEEEDILVFYLYRCGNNDRIRRYLLMKGIPDNSVTMRISNFQVLDGKNGLKHWAKQSESVYVKYKNIDKDIYLQACMEIIEA